MRARLRLWLTRRAPGPKLGRWRASGGRIPGGPQDMSAFRPQQLSEIVRVVPVGERRSVGNATLTLLSVELYTEGTIAQFLVAQRLPAVRLPGIPNMSQFAVALTDDAGNNYASRPYGGSGGSDGPSIQWRTTFAFAPAVSERVRQLKFRIESVTWLGAPDPSGQLTESFRALGPWEFVIGL